MMLASRNVPRRQCSVCEVRLARGTPIHIRFGSLSLSRIPTPPSRRWRLGPDRGSCREDHVSAYQTSTKSLSSPGVSRMGWISSPLRSCALCMGPGTDLGRLYLYQPPILSPRPPSWPFFRTPLHPSSYITTLRQVSVGVEHHSNGFLAQSADLVQPLPSLLARFTTLPSPCRPGPLRCTMAQPASPTPAATR
jgi:hypothetical protein